ncbi:14945_t:CDS:2 [Cetraspora pellucida]|uniref:14945_t:CDS:1 n=1 Tax=Cetraspora pellucida TaxID=1433469 RepID=A0ACA9N6K8_9GLOM|nr:14945_t:CDS:2 [Cetraspora pellucida]
MDLDYSEDNVDITEYFEESYNKDVSDIANNIESLSLKEDDSFDDFDKAEGNNDFCVFVTTLNDNHNHDLLSKVIQFEKDKQFTEEMQEEINFLVTKCRLGATMVRHILKEKFTSHLIFAKNLYVEIQRCWPSCSAIKCDASQFYEQLLSKQCEDSC